MLTIGPNGITENAVNAQIAEMIGAKKKTTLSARFGRMSSLNGQLQAVGEGLQQAERADLVGAGPHLHPGHHPALEPDAEQRQPADRTTKTTTILMRTSHHGSWPKSASVGSCARTARWHLRVEQCEPACVARPAAGDWPRGDRDDRARR